MLHCVVQCRVMYHTPRVLYAKLRNAPSGNMADAAHVTYDTYLKCVLHTALFTVLRPYVHVEAYFISKRGWSRMNPAVSKIGRSAGTGR